MFLLSALLRQVDKGVSVLNQLIPKQNRQVCSQGTCKPPFSSTWSSVALSANE